MINIQDEMEAAYVHPVIHQSSSKPQAGLKKTIYVNYQKKKDPKSLREKFENILDNDYIIEGKAPDDPFKEFKERLDTSLKPKFRKSKLIAPLETKQMALNNVTQDLKGLSPFTTTNSDRERKFRERNYLSQMQKNDTRPEQSSLYQGGSGYKTIRSSQIDNTQSKFELMKQTLNQSKARSVGSQVQQRQTQKLSSSSAFLRIKDQPVPLSSPILQIEDVQNNFKVRKSIKTDLYAQMQLASEKTDLAYQTDFRQIIDNLGGYTSVTQLLFEREQNIPMTKQELFRMVSKHINTKSNYHS